MSANMEMTGLNELIDRLEELGQNVDAATDAGLKKAAVLVLADAKQTSAFKDKTGKLRKSMKITGVKKNSKSGDRYLLVGTFGENAFYGRYVEYGTSKMDPHPFLHPALERNRDAAVEIIKQSLQEAIDDAR